MTQHTQYLSAPPPVVTEGHVPGPTAALALPDAVRRKEERRARFWGFFDMFSTKNVPDDVPTERCYVYFARCQVQEAEIWRWSAEAKHAVRLAVAGLGPIDQPEPVTHGVADLPATTGDVDAVRWAEDLRSQREAGAQREQALAAVEQNTRVLHRLQADLDHIDQAAETAVHANITHTQRLVALYTRARRGLFSRNASQVASLPDYPRYTSTFVKKGANDVA